MPFLWALRFWLLRSQSRIIAQTYYQQPADSACNWPRLGAPCWLARRSWGTHLLSSMVLAAGLKVDHQAQQTQSNTQHGELSHQEQRTERAAMRCLPLMYCELCAKKPPNYLFAIATTCRAHRGAKLVSLESLHALCGRRHCTHLCL